MELIDILGLGIVGGVLSIAFDLVKHLIGDSRIKKQAVILGLSVVLGVGYYFLRDTALLGSILGVLAASQIAYSFLLKNYA